MKPKSLKLFRSHVVGVVHVHENLHLFYCVHMFRSFVGTTESPPISQAWCR